MPRVPTYDAPQVRTQGIGAARLPAVTSGVGEGLQQVGQGVSQVGLAVGRTAHVADEMFAKAAAADVANAEVALSSAETRLFYDANGGLFRRKGQEAFAAEQETFKAWSKERDRIAKGLGSEKARALFSQRAARLEEGLRRQTESFLAREGEAALEESSRAREAAGYDAIAKGKWADPVALDREIELIASAAAALARTPEGRKQRIAEVRQRAYMVAMEQHLAQEDVAGARALFARVADHLGARRTDVEARLKVVERKVGVESTALSIVQDASNELGWVDEDKALAALDALPAGERAAVRPLLEHRLSLGARKKARDIDEAFKTALSAYNRGGLGAVPAPLGEWLNTHAPEKWNRLLEDTRQKSRMRRADAAEQRRAQAMANLILRNNFLGLPLEQRAQVDLNEFALGSGANPVGLSALAVEQRRAKEQLEKGWAVTEAEFRTRAKAAVPKLKGKQLSRYTAEATIALSQFQEQHKRAPNEEETKALLGLLTQKVLDDGIIFDSEIPAWQRNADLREDGKPVEPYVAPRAGSSSATSSEVGKQEPTRPSKKARALQLSAAGRTPEQIAAQLTEEGY